MRRHRKHLGVHYWDGVHVRALLRRAAAATLLSVALAVVAAAAQAGMRCDGRLVQVGDRQYDVLRLCGEPDYRTPTAMGAYPYMWVPQVEEWQYNFGPHRLMRILRFHDGRITQIRSVGYGFSTPATERCTPQTLRPGLTQIELLARCGEPDHREVRAHQYLFDHRRLPPINLAAPVEDWFYEFGPGEFYRVVRVVDGQVVRVETGRR